MERSEKTTLIFFDILFFLLAVVAGLLGKLPQIPDWLFLFLLGIAAYRGGRAVSYNYIFKWLRDMFLVVEEEDSSGAGMSNNASGKGVMRALGELLCCPICSGTWVGLSLLFVYSLHPMIGTAIIYAVAAAGVAEIMNWMSEYYSWRGRLAREDSGSQWLYKNRPETLNELDRRRYGSLSENQPERDKDPTRV